jgi:hypothetical protein
MNANHKWLARCQPLSLELINKCMIKNFARLVVNRELTDDEVADYVATVSEVVDTKVVYTVRNGERTEIDVLVYQADDRNWIYEVVLKDDIGAGEGEEIAYLIEDILDDDFDFEISTDAGDY